MIGKRFAAFVSLACLMTVGICQHQHYDLECAPSEMSKCTDPLKVVTDNKDLGFATSREELDDMCPKLMAGLKCIDDFTVRCLDKEHRVYFNTLYAGTTQVIIDLCQEGTYQSDYLRHAPCMREVQTGYEKCASSYQQRIKTLNRRTDRQDYYQYYDESEYAYEYPADEEWAENQQRRRRRRSSVRGEESVRLLCCSFQKYLHCSESVVNETCGYETAKFTKSFLDRMSGPLIQGHCQAYEYGSDGCMLLSVENELGNSQPQHSSTPGRSSAASFRAVVTLLALVAFLLQR